MERRRRPASPWADVESWRSAERHADAGGYIRIQRPGDGRRIASRERDQSVYVGGKSTSTPAADVPEPAVHDQSGATEHVHYRFGLQFPGALAGTLMLQFVSSAINPAPDPMVLFLSGGTTLQFTIPANQTTAVFTAPNVGVQTGTVAGTITIKVVSLTTPDGTSVLSNPVPSFTITVPPGPPVITSPPTVTKTTGGLTLTISGYSPLRTVTTATFNFAPSGGATLQTSNFTVDVTSAFNQYYQGASSMTFGSMFIYTQPFTFQGTLNSGSITVTLSNSAGSSQPMTVQF